MKRILALGFVATLLTACDTTREAEVDYTPPANAHAKLAGSSWYFGDGPTENSPTLIFDQDGKVSGTGGCNQYFGNFFQEDGVIEGRHQVGFGALASTEMACMGDAMDLEVEFFENLSKVKTFNIVHGNALLLFGEEGRKILRLRKARP